MHTILKGAQPAKREAPPVIQSTQLQVLGLPVVDSLPFFFGTGQCSPPLSVAWRWWCQVFCREVMGSSRSWRWPSTESQPHHHGDGISFKTGHAMEIGPKQTAGTTLGRPSACLLGAGAVKASLLLPLHAQQMLSSRSHTSSRLVDFLKEVPRLCCISQ